MYSKPLLYMEVSEQLHASAALSQGRQRRLGGHDTVERATSLASAGNRNPAPRPSSPHGYPSSCTTCFNIKKLIIMPTQCIYVFHAIRTINRDYFPNQQ
jgi:hypothetical protein